MKLGRFFLILGIILAYGLLFSAQRMDAFEKTQTIKSLSRELELLNSRKQELTLQIKTEHDRLVLLSLNMGTPITPKDVILIDEVQ